MRKGKRFVLLVVVVLLILLFGGCVFTRFTHATLVEKMIGSAREYLANNYPQYDMQLFAVFAQKAEVPELFSSADELAYWKFVFSDWSDTMQSVEVHCVDGVWTSEVIDSVWGEDEFLSDPIYILFDIQDAINVIANKFPGTYYYGVYFHLPLSPETNHPEYKFHRDSMDFVIFNSVTGEFAVSGT